MAEGPSKQPKQERLNLPSLHHRVEDQVAAFIQRGLRLANEIEADLEWSAQHLESDPVPDLNPYPSEPSIQNSPLSAAGPWSSTSSSEATTKIQSTNAHPSWDKPEETDENSWAIVWLRRGTYKYQQADYSGAQDNFKQALQKQPTLGAAYNGLGSVLYQKQNFVEAIVAYHQALDHASQSPELYCNLGSALYQIQNFDEAALAYQKAIHYNPYLQPAYYGLGLAQHQIGLLEEAVTAFEQATQLDCQHANSFLGLAATLYDLEEYPDANTALRRAMQLDSLYIELYLRFQSILFA